MQRLFRPALLFAATALALPAGLAQRSDGADGWVKLFNGKDLTGWGYKTKDGFEGFDGKTAASDGRYSAKDGVLTVNPGKGLKQLWTKAAFPTDFELRLEFRAAVNADSGLFIRGPQLQVRDYPVAGPFKDLKKHKAQDWNEVVVVVTGQVAHCTSNGEVLDGMFKLPATGPMRTRRIPRFSRRIPRP